MLRVSIQPKTIKPGDNSCTVYFNYGSPAYPQKTLTLETVAGINFVEKQKEKKQLSWKKDDADAKGFKHDVVIRASDSLEEGDVFKIRLTETDSDGREIGANCSIQFKL